MRTSLCCLFLGGYGRYDVAEQEDKGNLKRVGKRPLVLQTRKFYRAVEVQDEWIKSTSVTELSKNQQKHRPNLRP